MDDVAARLRAVASEIEEASRESGRAAGTVRLIAVSKTVPAEIIREALLAGQRDFGENRVQEAKAKWPQLREEFPDLRLHLIGPLQSNKAKEAVALFDTIQSVDRPRIAEALAEEMTRQGKSPQLLVQVNIGKEPQKAGIPPEEVVAFVEGCRQSRGLDISGLMCIPPFGEPPAPFFALAAKLAREANLPELSMGMSGDFTTAVGFGATMVRVGTGIFGERPPLGEGG